MALIPIRHDELVDQHTVVIGHADGDRVIVTVVGRMHPEVQDHWDGNWLTTPIRLHIGGFSGTLGAGLRVEELGRFREELEGIYADLTGMAVLASIEGWLTIRVTCRNTGSLEVTGVACDQPGTGNRLEFAVEGLDQTYLPPLIEALRQCEQHYPGLGRP